MVPKRTGRSRSKVEDGKELLLDKKTRSERSLELARCEVTRKLTLKKRSGEGEYHGVKENFEMRR